MKGAEGALSAHVLLLCAHVQLGLVLSAGTAVFMNHPPTTGSSK